jgi:GTP:adenosylcobinamide-phosphate guanylyltransferase
VSGTEGAWGAIVLAGSRGAGDPVAAARGVSHKAIVPVAGRPMLDRVLEALAGCPQIGPVLVVIERPELLAELPVAARLAERVRAVPAAATPSLSVRSAAGELGRFPALVTTADHPLLTPELVGEFLDKATATGADFAVGVASDRVVQAAFPEGRRTYWRFRDAGYSGANLFALLSPQAAEVVSFWRRAERERKRPWRMALAIGPWSLVLYLLGRFTLQAAMRRASRIIGAQVAAVVLDEPHAAVDVDRPADLELVERILKDRAGQG